MLTKRNTVLLSLALVGFLLVLAVGDFLALHDIQQDYVSSEALSNLELDLAGALPYWTATSSEWTMVSVSLISRFVLLGINALVLLPLLRRGRDAPDG
jgi:hypothetical protein